MIWMRKEYEKRLDKLIDYLEEVNRGSETILAAPEEGQWAKLQDEIAKTVGALRQSRDDALSTKAIFSRNLTDIAHQMKTPLTSLQLTIQELSQEDSAPQKIQRIQADIDRLVRLSEALLLMARIDAGAIQIKPTQSDLYTLLAISAENLDPLSRFLGVPIEIDGDDLADVFVDVDWTLEALESVLKNCLEHSPTGHPVSVTYSHNPLYAEIIIEDEGPGFSKQDLSHLFERFFRGSRERAETGIGLGLALSRDLIEMQNGTITARNGSKGGACFEIRFYRH